MIVERKLFIAGPAWVWRVHQSMSQVDSSWKFHNLWRHHQWKARTCTSCDVGRHSLLLSTLCLSDFPFSLSSLSLSKESGLHSRLTRSYKIRDHNLSDLTGSMRGIIITSFTLVRILSTLQNKCVKLQPYLISMEHESISCGKSAKVEIISYIQRTRWLCFMWKKRNPSVCPSLLTDASEDSLDVLRLLWY